MRPRVLTGIRPTGPLHLGHYVGALKQWLPLQTDYDCFFLVADVQALTTHADRPEMVRESVKAVVADWISVGLDHGRPNVHFVLQSALDELSILTNLFTMVTPFNWMKHNPTIKEELKTLKGDASAGFMIYPISQASDILFVSPDPGVSTEPILVPVGMDQVPHLRDTNRIARKFNELYGPTFVECSPLIGQVGRLVGTDGDAKMSKSLDNAIYLTADSTETVRKRVFSMYTDPKRIRADIPGTVEGNPVFEYHDALNPNETEVEDLKERYRQGRVGDVEVKGKLFKAIENLLEPFRERRSTVTDVMIYDALAEGTAAARQLAEATVHRTMNAMHLTLDLDHYGGGT